MDEMFFQTPSPRQRRRDLKADKQTGDLFAIPAVRSETSQAAAATVNVDLRAEMKRHVLMAIRGAGAQGLARFEVAELLGKAQNDITSTILWLIANGDVVETNRKRKNPRSNKECFVLVAAEYARG